MISLIVASMVIGMVLVIVIALLISSIIVKEWLPVIFTSISVIIFIAIEISIISKIKNTPPEPTAIDVYRGLTELEITSVNGVPTDTVVVFKNR
jgi:hypothetical protein